MDFRFSSGEAAAADGDAAHIQNRKENEDITSRCEKGSEHPPYPPYLLPGFHPLAHLLPLPCGLCTERALMVVVKGKPPPPGGVSLSLIVVV